MIAGKPKLLHWTLYLSTNISLPMQRHNTLRRLAKLVRTASLRFRALLVGRERPSAVEAARSLGGRTRYRQIARQSINASFGISVRNFRTVCNAKQCYAFGLRAVIITNASFGRFPSPVRSAYHRTILV